MGRPIKYDAEYFSHSVHLRDDLKNKALRKKHGLIGYGVYLMILETLAGSPLIQLELTELQYEMLSGDFDIEVIDLAQIIEYSIHLNILQLDNGMLRSQILDDSLTQLFSHRKMSLKELRKHEEESKRQILTPKLLETTHSKEEKSSSDDSEEEMREVEKKKEECVRGEEKRGGEQKFDDFYGFLNTCKSLRPSDEPPISIHEEAELDSLFNKHNLDRLNDAVSIMAHKEQSSIHSLKNIIGEIAHD
jgi:hypothetical protein